MQFLTVLFLVLSLALSTFALPNGLPEYHVEWSNKDSKPDLKSGGDHGFNNPHEISSPFGGKNPWKPVPQPEPKPGHEWPQPPHYSHLPFPSATQSWTATRTSTFGLPTQSVHYKPWKRNEHGFIPQYNHGHQQSVTRQPWKPTATSTASGWPTPTPYQPGKGNPFPGWPHQEPHYPAPQPGQGGHGEPGGSSSWQVPKASGPGWGEHEKREEEYAGRARNDFKREVLEA